MDELELCLQRCEVCLALDADSSPYGRATPLDTTVSDIAVPLSTGTVHVRWSRVLKFTDPILSCDDSG